MRNKKCNSDMLTFSIICSCINFLCSPLLVNRYGHDMFTKLYGNDCVFCQGYRSGSKMVNYVDILSEFVPLFKFAVFPYF